MKICDYCGKTERDNKWELIKCSFGNHEIDDFICDLCNECYDKIFESMDYSDIDILRPMIDAAIKFHQDRKFKLMCDEIPRSDL